MTLLQFMVNLNLPNLNMNLTPFKKVTDYAKHIYTKPRPNGIDNSVHVDEAQFFPGT